MPPSEVPDASREGDYAEAMLPQLRPRVWRGRGTLGKIAFVLPLVVGAAVMLAAGLLLVTIAAIVWLVTVALWLVGTLGAWLWFLVQGGRRIPYPFRLRPPTGRRSRTLSLSSLYLASAPRMVGAAARLSGFLLSPIALLVSAVGIFAP